jgi:adenosylcobinamide kinase/adenosylcobinamide-phosphate guanylyltransferase
MVNTADQRNIRPREIPSVAHIQFILGGARSGKSAHAEDLAARHAGQNGSQLVYMATAEIFDDEMRSRIQLHRDRRGPEWQLVETPLDLPTELLKAGNGNSTVLVDCLSVWTTNLLIHERDLEASRAALLDSLAGSSGHIVLVASETGLGIIPDNALSRRFRDANGLLNQAVAALADEVFFVTAGLALRLKPQS